MLELLLGFLAAAAACPSNFEKAKFHRSRAVAQLGTRGAGQARDRFHRAREHPHPVAEERTVGRIVDVGLHHRGIDAHPAPGDDLLLLGDGHHPLMDLLDDLRAQCDP